jgi:hypothetical protein
MQWPEDKLTLDLNRDRIRTVLRETYETCRTVLGTSLDISVDDFVAQIEPYLQSNRVAIPVKLTLPCKKFQDPEVEVNLQRAKVIIRMSPRNKKWQVELNRYLRSL